MEGGGSKEVSACATHTYIDRITQHRVDGTASANFVFTCGIAERSFYVAGFIFLFWPTAHENYLYFQITPPPSNTLSIVYKGHRESETSAVPNFCPISD